MKCMSNIDKKLALYLTGCKTEAYLFHDGSQKMLFHIYYCRKNASEGFTKVAGNSCHIKKIYKSPVH